MRGLGGDPCWDPRECVRSDRSSPFERMLSKARRSAPPDTYAFWPEDASARSRWSVPRWKPQTRSNPPTDGAINAFCILAGVGNSVGTRLERRELQQADNELITLLVPHPTGHRLIPQRYGTAPDSSVGGSVRLRGVGCTLVVPRRVRPRGAPLGRLKASDRPSDRLQSVLVALGDGNRADVVTGECRATHKPRGRGEALFTRASLSHTLSMLTERHPVPTDGSS